MAAKKDTPTPSKPPTYEDMDRRIDMLNRQRGVPRRIGEAVPHVHDTLEIAWLSARVLFGDKATPDVAFAIYDRINTERQRLVREDDHRRRHGDEEDGDEEPEREEQ